LKKNAPKILLLDIETAPTMAYIWDLFTRYVPHSQVVEPGYTLCWAAKWLGSDKMMFKSVDKHGEEDMIDTIWDLLEEADIVIHFNGSKYDIPKLNAEFLLWDMGPPAPFQEIDLYRCAKGRFKLLSNSMAYVAKVLGIEGKHHHKGMELWTECMAGVKASWREMELYNKQDVVMLEQIYARLRPWIQPHPNLALWNDDEEVQCPKCGGTNMYKHPKIHTTQTMRYQRLKCRDCGTWTRERTNNLAPGKKKALLVPVK
jgi:hypothetical protein